MKFMHISGEFTKRKCNCQTRSILLEELRALGFQF